MKNIGLIFAGGIGSRMTEADVPKQFLTYEGKQIIIYTLELFERHPQIDDIVVVCVEQWIGRLHEMLSEFNVTKVSTVVPGGATTQASIYNGLCAVEERYKNLEDVVVLVHDGVRPLINEQTISDNIEMVRNNGNCVTCVKPIETVLLNPGKEEMTVPRRSDMLMARAPQSFFAKDILACHHKAIKEGNTDFIDCCEMVRYYGGDIHTIIGPSENIKITTATDFFVFKAMIEMRKSGHL